MSTTGGHRGEVIAEIEQRRAELNIGLLKIYNYYRVTVGFALMAALAQDLLQSPLGSLNPDLYWWVALAYTGVNIITSATVSFLPHDWFKNQRLTLALTLFDVLSLSTLMYASGGIGSGIAALLLVTVAAGAILLTGRLASLIAATASIAILYEESYLAIAAPEYGYDFFQAGVFGIIYFIASLSIQGLTKRIRANDIRALTQAIELADLERLNRLIIQRMRTGIIVVDQDDSVRLSNQSGRALIGVHNEDHMATLPTRLSDELSAWRHEINRRGPPFQINPNTPEIRANFSAVRAHETDGDVTIFLEDTREIQQQAQQLKLAELGRLSASIAHEVRNPLGAISHAAQLLNESEALTPPDQRLTDIIINHCHRMNGVVENVLEMSQRKSPNPSRVNLGEHLHRFRSAFSETLSDVEIEVEVQSETTSVRVDPKQLDQALTNLVDNGIRYSEENGHGQKVRIECGIEASSERPFLNVIDFGKGVDPAMVTKLFQPFSTSSQHGTGLGLYLSRELCESNQAQLSYYPHEAGGSCFRILFSHPDRITA